MAKELRRGFGGNGGGDSLTGLDDSSSNDTNSGIEFVLQSFFCRYFPCAKMLVILVCFRSPSFNSQFINFLFRPNLQREDACCVVAICVVVVGVDHIIDMSSK